MANRKRLFAFGCSHTFGHSLPDAHPPSESDGPSNFAWPQLLATDLGMKCFNLGKPGASPKRTLYNIVNCKDLKSDSVVIILWPNSNRNTRLLQKDHGGVIAHDFLPALLGMKFPSEHYEKIEMTHKEHQEFLTFYYEKLHNDYNASFDFATIVNTADNYLRRKHIIPIHIIADHDNRILVDKEFKHILAPMLVKQINWKKDFFIDHALDGSHPGLESNKLLAQNLKKWFF